MRIRGDAEAGTSELAEAVRRLGMRGAPLRLRGREISSWPTMASTGLRHGEIICCGEPYAAAPPPERGTLAAGHHVVVVAGPDAGRTVPVDGEPITIGRSITADLCLTDPEMSAHHATIKRDATSLYLRDVGSTNGTVVEGRALLANESQRLNLGDYVVAGSSVLTVVDFDSSEVAVFEASALPEVILQRQFRPALEPLPRRLTPPTEPRRGEPTGPSWWRSLTPLITGVGFAAMTGRWEFLLITALAPILFFFDTRRVRRQQDEQRSAEASAFQADLTSFQTMVTELRTAEKERRRDQAALGGMATARCMLRHRRLWERRPGDSDFGAIDLGLAARPVRVSAGDDDVVLGPPAHWNVPVTASLIDLGSMAIIGADCQAKAVLRGLVLGLASSHAPTELRMWFFCPETAAESWEFVRWLPHALDEGCSARLACSTSEMVEQLARLSRLVGGRTDDGKAQKLDVVVIDQSDHLPPEMLAELMRKGPLRGVTCLVTNTAVAPDGAGGTIDISPIGLAQFRSTDQPLIEHIHVAAVSEAVAIDVALSMAPLRTVDSHFDADRSSPRLLDLVGMAELNVDQVIGNWSHHGATTEAIVGTSSESPMAIDIARHGPHGLIGGMSGSGKTELLMTLLSSLCLQNHPDDLAIAIVDFKGGVDHGLTGRLPHVVGLSTNLDIEQFSRTIELLDAEQRRRQTLLNGVGSDLNAYRMARASRPELPPVPRLLVIVDEFGELLATEQGKQHLSELIRVTRIGRALGVHLLLVTQNFEGQLPPQIEANAGLRICLRVMRAGHSKIVLGTGAAAELDERDVGRAIARLNGQDLVEFQTARVAGRRGELVPDKQRPTTTSPRLDIDWLCPDGESQLLEKGKQRPSASLEANCPVQDTDMFAITEVLTRAAVATGWTGSAVPWPAVLPSRVPLSELLCRQADLASGNGFPFGLEDRPDEQRQCPTSISVEDGDILLLGGPGADLSGALQTIALSAASVEPPSRLHLHLIDLDGCGLGPLPDLPHIGTIAVRDERLALRLLDQLDGIVANRRLARQFDAAEVENTAHQMVLVYGADRLVRRGEDRRHPMLDPLMQLMLEAPGLGVQFVLAGLPSLGDSRLVTNISRRFVFQCSGDSRATSFGAPPALTAALDQPGRAVDTHRQRLVQVASTEGPNQIEGWVKKIEGLHQRASVSDRPLRLHSVDWPLAAASVQMCSAPSPSRLWFPLGVESDTGRIFWVDGADDGPMIVVTGPAKSGRTTALVSTGFLATKAGWRCIAVAGSRRSALAAERSPRPAETLPFDRLVSAGELDATLLARPSEPKWPLAVFLDDAHRLSTESFDLDLLTEAADVIVMAGPLDFVSGRTPFRKALPEHEIGLLLNPTGPLDGQSVGLPGRLPEDVRGGRRPGVGLAVVAGEATSVTVPLSLYETSGPHAVSAQAART